MLSTPEIKERTFIALQLLDQEIQKLDLIQSIRSKTREDLDEQQKEYFLQQQIKNIKRELNNGEGSPEKLALRKKALKKDWNENI